MVTHGIIKTKPCSLALIGYSSNTFMLLFAAFVNAFGYGAVQPMPQSMCIKSVRPEHRGSASSTNYIFMDAATIVGPSVCGAVAAAMGYVPAVVSPDASISFPAEKETFQLRNWTAGCCESQNW